MHDVPKELSRQWVAPDQQVAQLPNMPRDTREHATADARHASVGVNLHKHLLDLKRPRIELLPARMYVPADTKLVVDVSGLQQPLLKERAINGHVTRKLSQSDVSDTHGGRGSFVGYAIQQAARAPDETHYLPKP